MNIKTDQLLSAEKIIAFIDNTEDNNERVNYINKLGSLNIKTIRFSSTKGYKKS